MNRGGQEDIDVALVQPPGWAIQNPPLGLALLKSYLTANGLQARCFDLNILLYNLRSGVYANGWELENGYYTWGNESYVRKMFGVYAHETAHFVYSVLAARPRAIGISVHWSSFFAGRILARKFKHFAPETRILFGGPQAARYTDEWKSLLEDGTADAIVFGEGEESLKDYLVALRKGPAPGPIAGVASRGREGAVIDGGPRDLIRSLDDLPFADFADFDLRLYAGHNVIPTYFSRGCINRCCFCTEGKYFVRFRNRSGSRVFAELMHQKALYPATEQFRMHDSVSNGNMRQLEQLCDLIIENRVSVKFNLENAVIRKEMDERLYRKLRHAGCTLIGYGLESPSKPLLKNVGKMACLDADFEKVVKDGVRCGMTIGINMMFGLPGEKDEDFRGQLAFIRRLRKYRRGIIVNPALNFCYFPPGSEVFASPEKYDVDMAGGELYWESRDGQNTFLRRLARFEEFCETARKLGYSNLFGVTQNSNKQALIGQYYMVKQDHEQALHYFLRSFAGEVKTAELAREILRLYEKTARPMDEAGTQVARYVAEEDGVGAPGAGTLETVRELEEYVLRSSLIHSMRRIRGFVQARPKAIRSHPAGLWPRLRSRLQGNVLRVFEQLLHKVDDRDVLWEEMLREVDNKIEAALAARRRNGEERSGEPANEGGRGMSGLRGPAWAHDTEASRSGGDDGNSA